MKSIKEILQEILQDADNTGCDGLHTVQSELINEAKEIIEEDTV